MNYRINEKGFANIVLIVVIVAIIVVGGYFVLVKRPTPAVQQTPTPAPATRQVPVSQQPIPAAQTSNGETANWKTYKNLKLGLTIGYPPEWYSESSLFTKCARGSSQNDNYLIELGLDKEQIATFKSNLLLPENWYLSDICIDKNIKRLAYLTALASDEPNNVRIGIFDLITKVHSTFPNLKLSSFGIVGCGLLGFSRSNFLLYTCGKGDGPWWASSLFALNLVSRNSIGIEFCSSYPNEAEEDLLTCKPISQ